MAALPPIKDVLPHRAPMILLDRILACDEARLTAEVTVADGSLFAEDGAVPAHIGLEYMAQACGAWAGARALASGEAVRVGFLLGTRHYAAHRPCFRRGDRLAVSAELLYRDADIGAFACRIEVAGELAAEAQLTVYQPPDSMPKDGV